MFKIISDGSCDFSTEEVAKYGLQIVPFYITMDNENFLKEGIDITKDEYFNKLVADKNLYPKTAQPSPQDYVDVYEPLLKEGNDLLVLTISSKLSGSNQSANIAKEMMQEDYPERTIEIVDTLNASIGQGLVLREVLRMNEAGLELADMAAKAREVVKTVRTLFTLDSLEYLKKGGRIGPTQAFVGGILGLRPILQVVDGEIVSLENVRGKKRVLNMLSSAVVDVLKDTKNDANISIGEIMSMEDAEKFQAGIESSLDVKINNPITSVGVTIGTHTGPGAMAIAYCRKYEAI